MVVWMEIFLDEIIYLNFNLDLIVLDTDVK